MGRQGGAAQACARVQLLEMGSILRRTPGRAVRSRLPPPLLSLSSLLPRPSRAPRSSCVASARWSSRRPIWPRTAATRACIDREADHCPGRDQDRTRPELTSGNCNRSSNSSNRSSNSNSRRCSSNSRSSDSRMRIVVCCRCAADGCCSSRLGAVCSALTVRSGSSPSCSAPAALRAPGPLFCRSLCRRDHFLNLMITHNTKKKLFLKIGEAVL